jgi:endo-1,4-beta-xylanase
MNRLHLVWLLAVLLVVGSPRSSESKSQLPVARLASATAGPAAALRILAQAKGIDIGAAVAIGPLKQDETYRSLLAREFSMITAEGAMKFWALHPDRDRYWFDTADMLVGFARSNGMKVRGHTLVWHQVLPPWLTGGRFTRGELIDILKDHILTVVGHYRGQIVAWDVVNEAVEDPQWGGGLRKTLWLQVIGPEYLGMAFRFANVADPESRLFLNEYGAEALGQKSDAVYTLLRDLLRSGVPVHGVGLQMHVSLDSPPRVEDVLTNIRRLADLGLEVHITELDVRIRAPVTDEKLAAQARLYREVTRACLAVTRCKAIVLWGFTDKYSWIPRYFPGYGSALIFNEAYQPKPAYYAIGEALAGR